MERLTIRGFSKLELVVCILVIVVVATLLYGRYMALVVDAERAAFRGVMGWLQAGINVRMSLAVTRGDLSELKGLEGGNPMVLVEAVMNPPSNYLGELDEAAAETAPRGHWYFDTTRRLLVYRPRYREAMEGFEPSGEERAEFRLKVSYGAADNPIRVSGLVLERVDAAAWPLSKAQELR